MCIIEPYRQRKSFVQVWEEWDEISAKARSKKAMSKVLVDTKYSP
jgi:hypothetical protein